MPPHKGLAFGPEDKRNQPPMKPGAEKDIDMPTANPLTWSVDGVRVRKCFKTRCYVADADREVDAVVLVTTDGHNHYLWNPEETP